MDGAAGDAASPYDGLRRRASRSRRVMVVWCLGLGLLSAAAGVPAAGNASATLPPAGANSGVACGLAEARRPAFTGRLGVPFLGAAAVRRTGAGLALGKGLGR